MLTLEQVTQKLQDRNVKEVARRIDLCYLTCWRISTGRARNVSYGAVKKLSDYFEGEMKEE